MADIIRTENGSRKLQASADDVFAPIFDNMVKSVQCPCCKYHYHIPLIIDGDVMKMVEETLGDMMDKTGYTAAMLKDVVSQIEESVIRKKQREDKAEELRKDFTVVRKATGD